MSEGPEPEDRSGKQDHALVPGNAMDRALSLAVVAEGVETQEQMDFLRNQDHRSQKGAWPAGEANQAYIHS